MRSKCDLIDYALKHAAVDPDKAEDVLEFFCDDVDRGDVPDKQILKYLAKSLRRIVSGKAAPAIALNLTRVKGKRRRRTLEKIDEHAIDLACAVVRRMNAGEKRYDAIPNVADDAGTSRAVVKRAYEAYRRFVIDTDQV